MRAFLFEIRGAGCVAKGRLDSAERHVEIIVVTGPLVAAQHGPREPVAFRITILRQTLDVRSAGVGQSQQLCDFVERLASRVIAGRA